MRSIGAAERALELMVQRSLERVAFGKRLAEKVSTSIAEVMDSNPFQLHACNRFLKQKI